MNNSYCAPHFIQYPENLSTITTISPKSTIPTSFFPYGDQFLANSKHFQGDSKYYVALIKRWKNEEGILSSMRVYLPMGKSTFGRGPLFGLTNPEISDSQAEFNIMDNGSRIEIQLTYLGGMPMALKFISSTGEDALTVLEKNKVYGLEHNDCFLVGVDYLFNVEIVKSAKSTIVENLFTSNAQWTQNHYFQLPKKPKQRTSPKKSKQEKETKASSKRLKKSSSSDASPPVSSPIIAYEIPATTTPSNSPVTTTTSPLTSPLSTNVTTSPELTFLSSESSSPEHPAEITANSSWDPDFPLAYENPLDGGNNELVDLSIVNLS